MMKTHSSFPGFTVTDLLFGFEYDRHLGLFRVYHSETMDRVTSPGTYHPVRMDTVTDDIALFVHNGASDNIWSDVRYLVRKVAIYIRIDLSEVHLHDHETPREYFDRIKLENVAGDDYISRPVETETSGFHIFLDKNREDEALVLYPETYVVGVDTVVRNLENEYFKALYPDLRVRENLTR